MNRWDDMEQLQYQADIYYWAEGGMDEWGNPVPPEKVFVAKDLEVDFQPLTGQRRSASSGTEYESSHRLCIFDTTEVTSRQLVLPFMLSKPVTRIRLQDELTEPVKQGMKVDVKRDGRNFGTYIVVFIADYMYHLEVEVKRDV